MQLKLVLSSVLFGLGLAACAPMAATTTAPTTPTVTGMPVAQMPDIVDLAAGNKDFTTLVAAVQAAGLVEVLKSKGPFTVFAPTNAAFAKLPAGTVESLIKPENKATLVKILTYHVLSGRVSAADAIKLDGKTATTAQGSTIAISVVGGAVKINDATVIAADIQASNGVIHVIDTVLLPK